MNADISSRLQTGFGLLQDGRAHDALAIARECAMAAPHVSEAHHLMALAAKTIGQDDVAEAAFRQALLLAPNDAQILVNLGNWQKKRGNAEAALRAYERAIEAAPTFTLAWINLGITAIATGSAARAVEALEHAIALDPKSAVAWQALGGARRAADDPAGAETAYRKAADLVPASGANWIGLAVSLRFQGRPAEALPYLERARQTGFSGPELDDAESACRYDLGEVNVALALARALAHKRPDYVPAHTLIANLLWEHGAAIAPGEDPFFSIRSAALSQREHWPLQLAYLDLLLQTKRTEEALGYIRAIRARPGAPNLIMHEANALLGAGRCEEAHPLFEAIYNAMGVTDIAFLNAFIVHLFKSGRIELAAARAQDATQAHPESQEAWAYLATAWRLTNDPREHWLCDYERLVSFVEVEPPNGIAHQAAFMAALATRLDKMHKANREPMQQSLRGGSQTAGRLFGSREPIIVGTHEALIRAVERAIASLPDDPTHPYLRRKRRSAREIASWSVKLWRAGKHLNHIHPKGWMSSAFYVSLPPCVSRIGDNSQAGWIQFGAPLEDLGLNLAPRRMIQPKVGWLALFPSYMWHGTLPFDDAEPRMTIAFDMQPAD